MTTTFADQLGLRPPTVLIIAQRGVNAFPFGPKDHYYVLFAQGLLDLTNPESRRLPRPTK